MKILKADKSHKNVILKLLDECRSTQMFTDETNCDFKSNATMEFGGDVFDRIISFQDSAIFLAVKDDEFAGIVTVHKIPQIRLGLYVAEIEEMFVKEKFQRQGVAKKLVLSIIEWSISEGILNIRLASSSTLHGAHTFYEKMGFEEYGKAYIKKLT